MANNFKNSSIEATTTYQELYAAPSSSEVVILGLAIANKSDNVVSATVQFEDSSANSTFQLLDAVDIPAHTTLETLAGQKYILESLDSLNVKAGANSAIDIVLGVMEKT